MVVLALKVAQPFSFLVTESMTQAPVKLAGAIGQAGAGLTVGLAGAGLTAGLAMPCSVA